MIKKRVLKNICITLYIVFLTHGRVFHNFSHINNIFIGYSLYFLNWYLCYFQRRTLDILLSLPA